MVRSFCLSLAAAASILIATSGDAAAQETGALLLPEANAGTVVDIAGGGNFMLAPRFAIGLTFPTSICQGPGGEVYVAERDSGEVTIITSGGDFTNTPAFATGLTQPIALYCTPDEILVAENTGSQITDITLGGNFAGVPPFATLNQPADLFRDDAGRLLATNFSSGVYEISDGGPGVLVATDDLPPSAGSIGMTQYGDQLLVAQWRAGRIVDVSAGGLYSVAPTFATVAAPISLFLLEGGPGDEDDRVLLATWATGTLGGTVYDITSGTPVVFATGVAPYDVAEMAFIGQECGNGIVEGSEECDDGNDEEIDACARCEIAFCGDGYVREGIEICDDGNQVETDRCLTDCTPNVCGDGILNFGTEECDDGNLDNSDGCLVGCQLATCGDGVVQEDLEDCDDANDDNRDACIVGCVAAVCGDGFVRTGTEQCDDGNDNDADDCRNDCTLPFCGNGVVDPFEQCDDGNLTNEDDCLNSCVRSRCGDGFVQDEEECDDGNEDDSDDCTGRCKVTSCGDGILRFDEECDDGDEDDHDGCISTCVYAFCGDGIVQYGAEDCDDGNVVEGDGCDELCQKEFDVTTCAASEPGSGSGGRVWLLGLIALALWAGARRRRRS